MATVPNHPSHVPTAGSGTEDREQLRKDRVYFAIAFLVVVAIFALAVWLSGVNPSTEGTEFMYPMVL